MPKWAEKLCRFDVFGDGVRNGVAQNESTERDQAISKKVDGLLFLRSLRNALAKCGFFPDKIDKEIEGHIQAISDCLYQRGYDTAVAENQLDKDEQLLAGREIIEKELTQEYEEVFRNSWTEGYDAIKKPEGYIEPSDWDDYV